MFVKKPLLFSEQLSQMHCNILNKEGTIEGVMCGNSENLSLSDEWCINPTHERQFYWSNENNRDNLDCYSMGKCNGFNVDLDAFFHCVQKYLSN